MASGEELLKMDEAAREVRRTMALALAWVQDKEGGLFGDVLETNSEHQIAGAIRNVKVHADEWLATQRQWAERGYDDKDKSYPVSFYLGVGKELATSFTFDLGETFNQDVFKLTLTKSASDLSDAAEDAAKKVKKAVDFLSTTQGKLAAAAAGLLVLGGVFLVVRSSPMARLVGA